MIDKGIKKIRTTTQTDQVINNPLGYKILIYISMLYLTIMLCNAIFTNRYIGTDNLFVLGGTFTSPFVFILDDIIAEIYGYKIARSVIISGFAAQSIFIILAQLILMAPHPHNFIKQDYYEHILGLSLVRINFSGFVAYILANLINSYILSKWKVLLKGRYFWLRSLGSSTFSEALYSFIAILMMELNFIPLNNIIKIATVSFLIKAIYSITFAIPSTWLVNEIKRLTGIDVYDFPKELTPFKYANIKTRVT